MKLDVKRVLIRVSAVGWVGFWFMYLLFSLRDRPDRIQLTPTITDDLWWWFGYSVKGLLVLAQVVGGLGVLFLQEWGRRIVIGGSIVFSTAICMSLFAAFLDRTAFHNFSFAPFVIAFVMIVAPLSYAALLLYPQTKGAFQQPSKNR